MNTCQQFTALERFRDTKGDLDPFPRLGALTQLHRTFGPGQVEPGPEGVIAGKTSCLKPQLEFFECLTMSTT
jgi:hypothetical protein